MEFLIKTVNKSTLYVNFITSLGVHSVFDSYDKMIGLTFITIVSLSRVQSANTQEQVAGPCSTDEMRRAVVDKALGDLGCDNYICGTKSFNACMELKLKCLAAALGKILQVGLDASNPANSCAEILDWMQSAPSGYYWLQSTNGSAVRVYCDMTLSCKGVGGGWMQVAKLDMTNTSHQCPPGTRLRTDLPRRLCGKNSDNSGCYSVMFEAHGIKYNQVCGKIIAYQDETPDAFRGQQLSIDQNYVDGISLTHGRNPRKHIWTFAAALDEVGTISGSNCPCTNVHQTSPQPPDFIGNDYFCDTASINHFEHIFYGDDPLWDGAGCGPANTCCSLNNPPWFYKQLSSKTLDDIEMRICLDASINDEDIAIEIIELYVK